MEIKFLGHACFLLDDGENKVLIDPFLTGNGAAAAKADDVDANFIFVTHGHSDHIGDTESIAKRNNSTVCCTVDLADAVFGPAGLNVAVGNIGGVVNFPFGSAKFVSAVHGSGVPGGLPCGFIIEIGGKKIYHAGDTSLIADMALLAEEKIDVALLPIGSVFTMGPEDAVRAAKMIQPKTVIPMHFGTFPLIDQDAEAFAAQIKAAGMDCKVLSPGETLSI